MAKKSKRAASKGMSSKKKAGAGKKVVAAKKKAAPAVKAAPKKPVPIPPKKAVVISPKNTGSKQYTQSEFIECVRGSCGFRNRAEAREFYGRFAGMVQGALKNGYKLSLPGLGKLQVKKRKARMGRNPMTQEPIMIPAKKKVAFTALKALKDSVL